MFWISTREWVRICHVIIRYNPQLKWCCWSKDYKERKQGKYMKVVSVFKKWNPKGLWLVLLWNIGVLSCFGCQLESGCRFCLVIIRYNPQLEWCYWSNDYKERGQGKYRKVVSVSQEVNSKRIVIITIMKLWNSKLFWMSTWEWVWIMSCDNTL